jgi:hypothetical protein
VRIIFDFPSYIIDAWINQNFFKTEGFFSKKKGGEEVARKHCPKRDKMTTINVTSEYGKTDSKKENVTENLE